jgi:hypothetical protein
MLVHDYGFYGTIKKSMTYYDFLVIEITKANFPSKNLVF